MNRQIDVNSGRCKIQDYLGVETEPGRKLSGQAAGEVLSFPECRKSWTVS